MRTLMENSSWRQHWATFLVLSCLLLGLPSGALSQTGTITTFDAPGAIHTFAQSINEQGAIAGYYYDAGFAAHGFVRNGRGTITTFDVPGALQTFAQSINERGAI